MTLCMYSLFDTWRHPIIIIMQNCLKESNICNDFKNILSSMCLTEGAFFSLYFIKFTGIWVISSAIHILMIGGMCMTSYYHNQMKNMIY